MRYQTGGFDDGLSGGEGVFERLLDLRNDVGLLSEEWDPKAARPLGNTPQAFSNFPLIVSALQLHAGRGRRSDERPTADG